MLLLQLRESSGSFTINIRNYNEDRVSIILNITKPSKYLEEWPKCSFFGIYDGHAGHTCADFLRDNLHKFIINDTNFPKNPQKAILNGFIQAEKLFIDYSIECNLSKSFFLMNRRWIREKRFLRNCDTDY